MPPGLICSSEVEPFISFGPMPIANGFLESAQFADEKFFDLQVAFCSACKMVQLTSLVDREAMFHDHYAFFSSTSRLMAAHFTELAGWIRDRPLRQAELPGTERAAAEVLPPPMNPELSDSEVAQVITALRELPA